MKDYIKKKSYKIMSNAIHIRNLKPENIKKDVEIFKVKGTYEGGGPGQPVNEDITVNSSTNSQEFSASTGYTGLGTVTVNPYTLDSKTVDSSTVSQTINSSVDGLSSVTVNPYTLDSKTVDSSTVSQTVNSSVDGLSSVTVNPYTLDSKTVDPSTSQVIVNSSVDGLSSVTINAVTSSIDANIQAGNIKQGETILGVTGTYAGGEDWILAVKNTANAVVNTDTEGLCDINRGMNYVFNNTNVKTITFTNTQITGSNSFDSAFNPCANLQSVSFPNLTTVSSKEAFKSAFNGCTSLQSISFPNLTTVSGESVFNNAFNGCTGLSSISFNMTAITGTAIFREAFSGCTGLSSISFPNLTTVSDQYAFQTAFSGCTGLSSISFPNLTTVSGQLSFQNAFIGCTSLQSISFNMTDITGSSAFSRAFINLQDCDITFPELTTVSGQNALKQCCYGRNQGRILFPKLESITGANALSEMYEAGSGTSTKVPYEFPELKTINAEGALGNLFISNRGNISSLSFPKLEHVEGLRVFQGILANSNLCTTLSMPRLLYKNDNQTFRWFWNNRYQSSITTTPEFFKTNSTTDYAANIYARNITLVIPNDYTYLGGWNPSNTYLYFTNSWVDSLSDVNILHILQQLGNVSDYDQVHYTVLFTATTISDPYGEYTTAINKLTNAGWTVTGLTIQ